MLTMFMPTMLEISHPTEQELPDVLRFAFGHIPPNEQTIRINVTLQQYHSGQIDLQGIFQAKYAGDIVGALYSQCRPDGSVMFWVPALSPDVADESVLELLLKSLSQFCRYRHAFAAVAIADRNQTFDEKAFCSTGQFRHLSDLLYLATEISSADGIEESATPSRLQFIPLSFYTEDISVRLAELVKKTYQDSLDFSELMQVSPVELVLQGYKMDAPFRPELWFFIQQDGMDIGVLLLTDASPEQLELTYMGLIVPARRRGGAKEIVRFAKRTASRTNHQLLLTSVDAQNIPACQTYLAAGFKAWDRKKVYVRFFAKDSE